MSGHRQGDAPQGGNAMLHSLPECAEAKSLPLLSLLPVCLQRGLPLGSLPGSMHNSGTEEQGPDLVDFELAPHVAALPRLVPQLGHIPLLGALLYVLGVCKCPPPGPVCVPHLHSRQPVSTRMALAC